MSGIAVWLAAQLASTGSDGGARLYGLVWLQTYFSAVVAAGVVVLCVLIGFRGRS